MWSSDIARLTYIISSCATQGTSWTYDKKGSQMKKIVIEPALNYIRKYCYDFCQNNSNKATSKILEIISFCKLDFLNCFNLFNNSSILG